jgi:hypothetical protein
MSPALSACWLLFRATASGYDMPYCENHCGSKMRLASESRSSANEQRLPQLSEHESHAWGSNTVGWLAVEMATRFSSGRIMMKTEQLGRDRQPHLRHIGIACFPVRLRSNVEEAP